MPQFNSKPTVQSGISPTDPLDLTTKGYVDTADQGLSSNISNVQNSVSSLSSNLSSLSNTVAALTTNSLTDVTTSNVQNSEFLLYNANNNRYENKAFDAQYMTFQYADGGSPDLGVRVYVSVDAGVVELPVEPQS